MTQMASKGIAENADNYFRLRGPSCDQFFYCTE
jgi:hypothetical protein